jgi:PAS domain S-box-containing protein
MDSGDNVLRRQLDAAQQITHLGSWEWDVATGAVTWSAELYRIYGLEPGSATITFDSFLARVHPEDRERVKGEIEAAVRRGGRFKHTERIVRPDGSVRELDSVGEVMCDPSGRPTGLLGTCRDVTEERRREVRARALQRGETRALEMLASSAPLGEILAAIVRLIEEHSPGIIATVLLLDETGTRLRHGAAPGLPDSFNRAVDGMPIGPRAGSCGTAAFTGRPVYTRDIATDPLWADYRDLVATPGLASCWSTPILAKSGRVLGTFAVYTREPRDPDEDVLAIIGRATHVAGIAIERRQLDEELRALSDRIEGAREEERTGIAREIHDQLGQALTALKMDISWITRRLPDGDRGGAMSEKLAEMAKSADELIHAVRRISAELRPGILDDLGLQAAIEWQAEEFQGRTGTRCEVRSTAGDLQLERDLATGVFRIYQEALTNVARHARASHVLVELGLVKGRLKLAVSDDGVGLPAAPRRGSLGLLGMSERARRLGGELEIGNGSARGTIVSLTVPLRFPADRRTNTDSEIGP